MALPWLLVTTVLLAALLGALLGGRLAREAREDLLRDLDELEVSAKAPEVIADTERRAQVAYQRLFGDGRGLDGGAPMAWQHFHERYMAAALQEQVSNSLKGKHHFPAMLPGSLIAEEVRKKDAPETLDGQVEALLAQKRQHLAVARLMQEGKELQSFIPGPVPCASPLYEHVYSPIEGCSASNAMTKAPPCGRWEKENVATKDEVAAMQTNMLKAFQHLFHSGPMTSLAVDSSAWPLISKTLTQDLLERSRQAVSDALGGIDLFFSGALLVRLQIPPIDGEMQRNSSRGDEFSAHVDKANVASYDWSAILYLSTVGKDFEGGELLFLDEQKDSQLEPKEGQLVFFSSGLENVHRVRPMVRGRRLVLAMWFTCSQRHAHPDLHFMDRKTDS